MARIILLSLKSCAKEALRDVNGETRVLIDEDETELFKRFFPDTTVKLEAVKGNRKMAGLELITSDGAVVVKNTLNSTS